MNPWVFQLVLVPVVRPLRFLCPGRRGPSALGQSDGGILCASMQFGCDHLDVGGWGAQREFQEAHGHHIPWAGEDTVDSHRHLGWKSLGLVWWTWRDLADQQELREAFQEWFWYILVQDWFFPPLNQLTFCTAKTGDFSSQVCSSLSGPTCSIKELLVYNAAQPSPSAAGLALRAVGPKGPQWSSGDQWISVDLLSKYQLDSVTRPIYLHQNAFLRLAQDLPLKCPRFPSELMENSWS